jgi:hypothetical protein
MRRRSAHDPDSIEYAIDIKTVFDQANKHAW